EIAAPAPGAAEAAVRVREHGTIAASLRDRALERRDRLGVLAEHDEGAAVPEQRRRIAGPERESALERPHCRVCLVADEPGFAEQDQRLPVVGLDRQQRLEGVDRRGHLTACEELARLVELVPVLVENELAGEIA